MRHRLTRRTAALSGAAVLGLATVLALTLLLVSGNTPATPPAAVAASSARLPSAVPEPTTAGPTSSAAAPSNTHAFSTAAPRTISSAVHLVVPSVGMDVAVLPLTPEKGVIDPPTQHEGYWIEPYGQPVGPGQENDNTLYIAGHSWSKGSAAFNPLMGQGSTEHSLAVGDTVQVRTADGTTTYTVTRTEEYDKGSLSEAADVWEISPGRLVLLTCFLDAEGHDTDDNLVVFAES